MDLLPYRLVLLGLLGAGIVASATLRKRADDARGAVPRSADGPGVAVALRLAGGTFYGGLLLWIVRPAWLAWSALALPPSWRWTGAALVAAGIGLALWSLWHLGRNVTPTAVVRPDAELVVTGPYRAVRHPLYSSMLLTVPGCALLTANLLVLAAGVATGAVILWRTRREEEELLAHFGEAYARYMEGTGRILPRPW